MSLSILLLVYSLVLVAASLLGGWLPGKLRMTHTRTQIIMSFVSGLMLGVAICHLLPHSIVAAGGINHIDTVAWWMLFGLIAMFLLLRTFHFHQHDFDEELNAEEGNSVHPHVHSGHAHPNNHTNAEAHHLSWFGLALGMGLHTIIDGVALGAA
ncbi:MAG: hypothetical protein ACR2PS_08515, partial [Pseudomonadales bacterium]